MKKTVNINLGNQVFQIDEDAYQLLENYLNDLKNYFRKERESAEIIQDIEYRFAELFGEKTRVGYRVITIEIVEETIKRVGKPEELAGNEGEDDERAPKDEPAAEKVKRRFYRNPDDKILGGVASGIAAYFDLDPIWIRLLLAMLVLLKGVIIPVYILLWIIMPKAVTAAQKLEMRGERVTVENIGKTVTENFERISDSLKDELNKQRVSSGIRHAFDTLFRVLGVLIKVALAVVGLILLFPVSLIIFVLVVVVFALIGATIGGAFNWPFGMFEGTEFFVLHGDSVMNTILFASGHGQGFFALALLTAGVTIIAPMVALVYSVIASMGRSKPLTKAVKLTSLVIWLLSLTFTIYAIIEFYPAAIKIL